MQIITTHKGTEFDAAASVLAAKILYKGLTPIQATLFLAGLYEDTGNLTFPAKKAEDALAAAYLLQQGADLSVLNSFLRPAYGESQRKILTKMLQSADRMQLGGYQIGIHKLNITGHVNNLAVVVGMYREILNVDAAFMLLGFLYFSFEV